MNIAQRRSVIARRLETEHTVSVIELADEIGVSAMTVRRDLAELERQGYARRVHGGAVLESQRSFEPTLSHRASENTEAKSEIVRAAIGMCNQDESIAIDVGSTTQLLAEALRDTQDLRLVILTPSIVISRILADNPSFTVVVTGGVVRRGEYSLTGDLTASSLRQFHVDKAFLGIAGVSAETGLTEYNMDDATVKKAIVETARETIVLADSGKFGRTALCRVTGFESIHTLVTEAPPPAILSNALAAGGVRVVVARDMQPRITKGAIG